jgi:tetratricopeptide (TPR) repeat protein
VANVPQNVSGKLKNAIPDLPITTLAEATAKLPVGDANTKPEWKQVATKADRERWNDWGIGLLLQGDLKGAEYAFKKVTEAEPGYADGWLNVARALIQEGETEAAKPYIAQALKVDPSLARTYYFKALIEKTDGDYPAALKSLQTVFEKYPRDRVALNQTPASCSCSANTQGRSTRPIASSMSIRKTCKATTPRCSLTVDSAKTRMPSVNRNCSSASRPKSRHSQSPASGDC